MTKLEVLKSVEKALTSEVLDSFYSVTINDHNSITLQGFYKPYTMRNINEAFSLVDMSDWSISSSGYVELEIDNSNDDKRFIVDGEQIKLRIVLTN